MDAVLEFVLSFDLSRRMWCAWEVFTGLNFEQVVTSSDLRLCPYKNLINFKQSVPKAHWHYGVAFTFPVTKSNRISQPGKPIFNLVGVSRWMLWSCCSMIVYSISKIWIVLENNHSPNIYFDRWKRRELCNFAAICFSIFLETSFATSRGLKNWYSENIMHTSLVVLRPELDCLEFMSQGTWKIVPNETDKCLCQTERIW